MLTAIPTHILQALRNVLRGHPNSFQCEVLRKIVKRPGGAPVGGLPTLGGMAVLDSEDEEDYEYEHLGYGYAMRAQPFQPSPMMDWQDANNESADAIPMLIAPEADPGQDGYFEIKKHDVVYATVDEDIGAKLAFEVVGVETPLNIPPFVMRYICNRRAELDLWGA
jgi:hypothetical protein